MFVETKSACGEECKGNAMLQQIDAYGGLPTFLEGGREKSEIGNELKLRAIQYLNYLKSSFSPLHNYI